jgi:pseudouridine synthase
LATYSAHNDHNTDRRSGLEELAAEYPFLKTMHPVGRLDADTSGLLLFSSDGHLTQTILHPSTGIPREYEATVLGTIVHNTLESKLAGGIKTTEGVFAANLLSSHVLSANEITLIQEEINQGLVSAAPDMDDDSDNDEPGEKSPAARNKKDIAAKSRPSPDLKGIGCSVCR